jgi:methylphosphotriester-DNA--protein-cysteine methyltransferase
MIKHSNLNQLEFIRKIRTKEIIFAGNSKLKIYGTLHCKSGKRMKKENRIFFSSIEEAEKLHYRPCGHCMNLAYKKWKDGLV